MAYTDYADVRYNQVRQKASHNSYQRTEGLFDQIIYWQVRSIEFDLHRADTPGDWYIDHSSWDPVKSSVHTLDAAMAVLRGVQTALPQHEVITVFLENKDTLDDTHTAAQLDQKIVSGLGRANIFTPGDLIAYNTPPRTAPPSSLQAALASGSWPKLSELRGKFIFVLNALSRVAYINNGAAQATRTCFIAQDAHDASEITANNYYVFFNLTTGDWDLGPDIFDRRYVSRVYPGGTGWDFNDRGNWNDACNKKIHHLASNKVNWLQDPWSMTSNIMGWPFQGIDLAVDPAQQEAGARYGMAVNSGDIEGSADSFYFWYADRQASPDRTYDGYVTAPGSHCPTWGKGGIMARADETAGSPYFAILRPSGRPTGRDPGIRVQYRMTAGKGTTVVSSNVGPPVGVDNYSVIFFRLEISNGGKTCQAYASVTGQGGTGADAWVPIGTAVTFSTALRFQGLAASSHDDADLKLLFGAIGTTTFPWTTFKAIGSGTRAGINFMEANAPRRAVAAARSPGTADKFGHYTQIFNVENAPAHTQFLYWEIAENPDAGMMRFVIERDVASLPDRTQYGGTLFAGAFTENSSTRSIYVSKPTGNDAASFTLRVWASGLYSAAPFEPAPSYAVLSQSITSGTSKDRASGDLSLPGVYWAAGIPGVLLWRLTNNANASSIRYSINYDVSLGFDRTVFEGVYNDILLPKQRFSVAIDDVNRHSFYIGDPTNANQEPFLVSVFDVISLPPSSSQVGSVRSEAKPQQGEKHRSSDNFEISDSGSPIQLYWEVIPGGSDNANSIAFDVRWDRFGVDDTMWSGLKNNAFSSVRAGDKFYIADPSGATQSFTVKVYGIKSQP